MKKLMTCFTVASLLALSACQTSPTGRTQLLLVSDNDMDKMGAASFTDLKAKSKLSTDKAAINYIRCISTPLLKAANENPAAWEIQVFEDDSPNAFALPGRKIGVHTGMIKTAQNPEQLAAVIGHEIGHVQARHGAERVSLNMASQTAQQVVAVAVDGTEYAGATMAAIGVGAQYGMILPYSRTHESEADYVGLKIMARAGFDPQQSVELWRNMAKSGGGKSPEFMSTHPSDNTRIKALTKQMGEANTIYRQAKAQGLHPNCRKP
ncbi:MAG: M48 family metallopeptidase [Pseudomonadales bacterium]|nr:M48 family metallopeptidase [Pseudomonadales bacterium]